LLNIPPPRSDVETLDVKIQFETVWLDDELFNIAPPIEDATFEVKMQFEINGEEFSLHIPPPP
jgi:hypothetical protein